MDLCHTYQGDEKGYENRILLIKVVFFFGQILEKVYVQFQSFLEDPQYKDQHELQATMIRTFGKVAPHAEPHFRDEGRVGAKFECCLIVFH